MLVKQKAHDMIAMRRAGHSFRAIGAAFGCTGSAVYQAIRRASTWNGFVGEIDDSYRIWIENEAVKTRTNPATVAKALLIDAIEDARNGRD